MFILIVKVCIFARTTATSWRYSDCNTDNENNPKMPRHTNNSSTKPKALFTRVSISISILVFFKTPGYTRG